MEAYALRYIAVTIAEPESQLPLLRPTPSSHQSNINTALQNPKQHRASGAKRLVGRPSYDVSTTAFTSQSNIVLSDEPDSMVHGENPQPQSKIHHDHHKHLQASGPLVSQILDWLHEEKRKRCRRTAAKTSGRLDEPASQVNNTKKTENDESSGQRLRRLSDSSDGGLALEKLEQILANNMVIDPGMLRSPGKEHTRRHPPKRSSTNRSLIRKSSTIGSSDTEYFDGDVTVPSADVILDNSKTLSYSGGGADCEKERKPSAKRAWKEKEAWVTFKNEIVRLAHTLRLKGWRRVPLDRGGDIEVERLSGALTNAVYVVSPPRNIPQASIDTTNNSTSTLPRRRPQKLLLRIYGPQVEHLIDRESELQILRRLARKKIGPRLLGTFTNGRFEEFFNAHTLTASDLRVPEMSKNIAKRMRELHDGIELLEEERDGGPFVWRNWDKWVGRCEEVITWVDQQILSDKTGPMLSRGDAWKRRGLICGVKWSVFRETVDLYRRWLNKQYGGAAGLRQQLVFAHNDVNTGVCAELINANSSQTQYGNLLRLEPGGESPLLLPMNEHKQLVVIDFEYASANPRGLEFANHFTEWCYNYHDSEKAYACNTAAYPSPAEQYRFLKAYVQHRPHFNPHASATPLASPSPGPSSSISAFMLDSRTPPTASYADEERWREEETEKEIQRLQHETRLWRVANSAQWVAWGIVQAKMAGMDRATPTDSPSPKMSPDPLWSGSTGEAPLAHDKRPEGLVAESLRDGHDMPHEADEEEEFDYLGYAQERAMFFWGDCLVLGIVREEDLPEEVLAKVKKIAY
ncbi:hypothetical protein MMC13_007766 [Lambiella insularis]|nr:hypothetical protein [Lambiella insularis]